MLLQRLPFLRGMERLPAYVANLRHRRLVLHIKPHNVRDTPGQLRSKGGRSHDDRSRHVTDAQEPYLL